MAHLETTSLHHDSNVIDVVLAVFNPLNPEEKYTYAIDTELFAFSLYSHLLSALTPQAAVQGTILLNFCDVCFLQNLIRANSLFLPTF